MALIEHSTRLNPFDYLLDFSDYWAIVKRRIAEFVIPFAMILAIAAAVAFLLPATFKSQASFLIQRQAIPQAMVATTVDSYVEEQIEQIRQRLLARKNLLDIARKFGLHPQDITKDPDSVVQRLRDDIEIEMVDVRATEPGTTRARLTTIAFTVAFYGPTAEIAQAVTSELGERFLMEHQARRDAQAAEVSTFLQDEGAKLAAEIAELEKALAGFKQEELRQLPELMGTNLRLFEKTEQDIQNTRERIRALQEKLEATRAELSLTPAYQPVVGAEGERILTGSERLSSLTAQYLRTSARYTAQHPDVVRLAREIRLLAEQYGAESRADELMNELAGLQEQVRQARQRYSDSHPEVQRLERAVAAVQRGFESDFISSAERSGVGATAPDNPRFVALKTQLDSTQSNLRAEEQQLQDLLDKLQEYEGRLFQTPVVERQFKSLTRDYEMSLRQYAELGNKQQQAELARVLESGEGGEKFLLSSPAYLPTLPDSPNRIGIMLLGCFLAFAGAIGSVATAEYLDRTIRDSRMVFACLGSPPLVVIPRMRHQTSSRPRAGQLR